MDNVHYMDTIDFTGYNRIPDHIKGAIDRYINRGIPPGGFLEAVLANNLRLSIARGDIESRDALPEIVTWLHNYAPAGCWGTSERVEDWIEYKSSIEHESLDEGIARGINFINEDYI